MRDAKAFLRVEMMAGPRRAKEVEDTARAQGIAHSTLADARRTLGIVSERKDGQWVWRYQKARKS